MAKSEKRSVTMHDGRVLMFGKIEKVKKAITKADTGMPLGIRFDGDNGDSFFCDFVDLPDADWLRLAEPTGISLWALAHGFSQKIGDSYASLTDTADCLESVRGLWQRLCQGKWQSDTRGFSGSSILLEAILLAFPEHTRESAREILAQMKPDERLALQASEAIKPHFDQLQAARAKGDANELLGRFAPKAS